MKTYASNPGNVRVKQLRLLYHMPLVTLAFLGGGAALLIIGFFQNNAILGFLGAVCLGLLFWVIDNARYRFTQGDVNISKVLSLKPPLFAISTNMRNTGGSLLFPVVKIVRRKVPNVRGRRLKVGDYFATACLYAGTDQKPHWDNVYPVPLSVATDDVETIEHHDEQLEYLRDELEARLALVDTPEKPGLYFIDEARLAARKSRPAVPEV